MHKKILVDNYISHLLPVTTSLKINTHTQTHTYVITVKLKAAQLCLTLRDPRDYSPWNSPGQNTGLGSLSLLYGIFPTQGLNPGLLHCRQILYQLNHKGNPYIYRVIEKFLLVQVVCFFLLLLLPFISAGNLVARLYKSKTSIV